MNTITYPTWTASVTSAKIRLGQAVSQMLAPLGLVLAMVAGTDGNDRVDRPQSQRRARMASRRQQQEVVGPDPDLAASYGRHSSEMQNEESSNDQHLKNCEEAKRNGHTIPKRLWFSDEAVSGTKRDRAGLNAMLRAAENGEFSILYVYNLSRLARNSLISLSILKRLVHVFKIRVICPLEGLDSANGGWEFMASVVGAMNERFIADLAAGVLRGLERRLLAGYAIGDHVLGFGSQLAPGEQPWDGKGPKPKKVYIIDSKPAMVVCQIFEWFVRERKSISWIVSELNRQKVPKCHRSTSPEWHHAIVVGILENEKYIGIWEWGLRKNVRDPETGKLSRELRSEEQVEKWTRDLRHLQIVDDETFELAQRRLAENRATYAGNRRPNGKLHGSPEGNVHAGLLSGILMCGMCPRGDDYARFVVTGKYYRCPRRQRGTCECDKSALRKVADNSVLDVVRSQLLRSQSWMDVVHDSMTRTWHRRIAEVPNDVEELEKDLGKLKRRIERLMDELEEAEDADVRKRLRKRQEERNQILRDLKKAKRRDSALGDEPPTREWMMKAIEDLSQTLSEGNSAAARDALRTLVGGRILTEKVCVDGEEFLRGRFTFCANNVIAAILPESATILGSHEEGSEVVIDFVKAKESHPADLKAEEVKRLYDQGMLGKQIARTLNLSGAGVTSLLNRWFKSRGLEKPDGRKRRHTLPQPFEDLPLYQRIAGRVKEMIDAGELIGDIAAELDVDRNTITRAMKFAYESQGLPVPDGRTRRINMERKSRSKHERGNWRDDY